jgi:hypothetical protein
MARQTSERRRLLTWEAVTGSIAVFSLVAALVFNGIQVRDSARSQRQTKLATELALLTQLQGVLNQSVYSRVPYAQEFRDLSTGRRKNLSPAAYRVVVEEAANMDYFAWLFNRGFLTTRGADRLWGPRMICEWQQAIAPAIQNPSQHLPNLLRFVQARRTLTQVEPC